MSKVYLGLGSNLGDREENMRKAIQLIGERVGKVTKQSSFIETDPWGYESANRFLNAVVLCETSKKPREVLLLTQQIERDLGRKTKRHFKKNDVGSTSVETESYSDRPIDIDILLYDDLTVDEHDLQIPHPLMQERDFVMIPLKELTPKKNKSYEKTTLLDALGRCCNGSGAESLQEVHGEAAVPDAGGQRSCHP